LHFQKAYTDSRYKAGDFPVTEDLCKRVISLPMHTELSDEDLRRITDCVLDFVNR
jgi:UDP-2-acetamido-2-deoxy-ribo-hexuluronate aminotransferase